MRTGILRDRVTIRRMPPPTNSGGVPVPGLPEVLYARIPAEVVTSQSPQLERVFASQVLASATHAIRIRGRALLLTDEVVWHDFADHLPVDRVLRITGRAASQNRAELWLAVQEQTS